MTPNDQTEDESPEADDDTVDARRPRTAAMLMEKVIGPVVTELDMAAVLIVVSPGGISTAGTLPGAAVREIIAALHKAHEERPIAESAESN